MTTNGGQSWRAGGLGAAAGTLDKGVFRTTNSGESWSRFSNGLGTLGVASLAISANGKVLYAGTLGGGVFDYRTRSQATYVVSRICLPEPGRPGTWAVTTQPS